MFVFFIMREIESYEQKIRNRIYSVLPVFLPPIYNIVYPVILPPIYDNWVLAAAVAAAPPQGAYDIRCHGVTPKERIPSK